MVNREMDLVSIIVPIYNSEKYLYQCINSIINQTYDNIEIILVDDGSTDKSVEICREFAERDQRIKFLSQINSGPSVARNIGINHAKGNYIQFVDSDDTLEKNATEELVNAIRKGFDLVICGYKIVQMNKNIYRVPSISGNFSRESFLKRFGVFIKDNLINSPVNKLYRRDILNNNYIRFDENINLGEDLIFNLQYLEYCNKISVIPDVLYKYQKFNTNSLTQGYRKELFQNQQMLFKTIKRFMKKNKIYNGSNKEFLAVSFSNSIVISLANFFHEHCELDSKEIKREIKNIIQNDDVKAKYKYFKRGNTQKKIVGYFIKINSVLGLYYYFKVRKLFLKILNIIRKIII